jgi:lambda repressor-like predicted transcriptional regulator
MATMHPAEIHANIHYTQLMVRIQSQLTVAVIDILMSLARMMATEAKGGSEMGKIDTVIGISPSSLANVLTVYRSCCRCIAQILWKF